MGVSINSAGDGNECTGSKYRHTTKNEKMNLSLDSVLETSQHNNVKPFLIMIAAGAATGDMSTWMKPQAAWTETDEAQSNNALRSAQN